METPNTLDCGPNSLWLSWKANIISIGTGTSVGSYPIIAYKDESELAYEITAVGFESDSFTPWEFSDLRGIFISCVKFQLVIFKTLHKWAFVEHIFCSINLGEAYVVYTGGSNEFERFWMATHRQTISFSVKACRHAKIALSERIGDAKNLTYEVCTTL